MSNAIYPKYKEALIKGAANINLDDLTVKAALVDTGVYTYSAAHDFFDDVTGVVGTPQAINNTTILNGLFDGDNVTYTAVTGNTVEAIVIYIDTGTPATSRVVAYIDTGATGLPFTPNGGNADILWNAAGIFQL